MMLTFKLRSLPDAGHDQDNACSARAVLEPLAVVNGLTGGLQCCCV